MDPTITWFIIGIFVIGFMAVLCFGLAVLNKDLENRREQNDQSGNTIPQKDLTTDQGTDSKLVENH